jgi:cell division septum initiation protein DivIVA
MVMPTDIYFRTALSGYNRKDVMRFIEKLNAEQVERVSELNCKIRSAQTEAHKLSGELEKLTRRCDELEEALASRNEGDVINEEKAHKYDSMQVNYADIMLDAEGQAIEKLRDAEKKSAEILEEANRAFEENKKELQRMKDSLILENKRLLQKSKNEFDKLFSEISAEFEKTLSGIVE